MRFYLSIFSLFRVINFKFRIINLTIGGSFPATNENQVGNISLWGKGFSDYRSSVITRNAGITGVTGIGWYMYLNNGAPTDFKISTYQIPYGTYLMFATR